MDPGPISAVIAPKRIAFLIKSLPILFTIIATSGHLGWERLPWPNKMTEI